MPRTPKKTHDGFGVHVTKKGYLRFNNGGKRRGEYVHRYEAAKKLRRSLRDDEEVHHHNGNKLDFAHRNLIVLDSHVHGWVSARQAWFMRRQDIRSEAAFIAYFEACEGMGGNLDCSVIEAEQSKAQGQSA